MRVNLPSRISFAMWLVSAISALTTAFLLGNLLIRSHLGSIHQQLQSTAASLLSLGISDFSELEDFESLNTFIEDALQMERADKIVRVFDQKKKLVFTSVGINYDQLPDTLEAELKKPQFMTLSGRKQKYESLVMSYEAGKKKRLYYLQVAIPLPRYAEIYQSVWWQGLGLLLGLFGVSLLVSRWLAYRLLKPVTAIAAHLEIMDPNRIEQWKPLTLDVRGRYLDAIVEGINHLTQRTRSAMLQIRKMSRYVAHELRTPLTILRGEAETVLLKESGTREDYASVLKSSLEEVQRMTETVSTVLQVGEHSGALSAYRPTNFELKAWIQHNLPLWEKTLGRPIQWRPAEEDPVEVRSDPKLLFRLVDNLIRNVERHTPPGASCMLSLVSQQSDLRLLIEDNGLPLPEWMVEAMNHTDQILETDWVGLNLCHTLAELCGFKLHFQARPEGGLKVEIAMNV